jgi:hypothetical protein
MVDRASGVPNKEPVPRDSGVLKEVSLKVVKGNGVPNKVVKASGVLKEDSHKVVKDNGVPNKEPVARVVQDNQVSQDNRASGALKAALRVVLRAASGVPKVELKVANGVNLNQDSKDSGVPKVELKVANGVNLNQDSKDSGVLHRAELAPRDNGVLKEVLRVASGEPRAVLELKAKEDK